MATSKNEDISTTATKEKMTATARKASQNYPTLWEVVDNDDCNMTNQPSEHMPPHILPGSEESFSWARSVPRTHLRTSSGGGGNLTQPTASYGGQQKQQQLHHHRHHQQQSFFKILSGSFVVAQEFAISTLFLATHRCMICITNDSLEDMTMLFNNNDDGRNHDENGEKFCMPCKDKYRITMSFSIFSITLPIIAIWATTARWKQSNKRGASADSGGGKAIISHHNKRIYYRTVDAMLIAAMLRFLSSVLRSLTASYSSDTVVALAVGGMVLHLLSCDYGFANGERKQHKGNDENKNNIISSGAVDITSYQHGRPLFMGGTVAINSVFFSAVLLASRCHSDSTSYLFLMLTVVLFAYYPEARHIMALTFNTAIGEKNDTNFSVVLHSNSNFLHHLYIYITSSILQLFHNLCNVHFSLSYFE